MFDVDSPASWLSANPTMLPGLRLRHAEGAESLRSQQDTPAGTGIPPSAAVIRSKRTKATVVEICWPAMCSSSAAKLLVPVRPPSSQRNGSARPCTCDRRRRGRRVWPSNRT